MLHMVRTRLDKLLEVQVQVSEISYVNRVFGLSLGTIFRMLNAILFQSMFVTN